MPRNLLLDLGDERRADLETIDVEKASKIKENAALESKFESKILKFSKN